MNRSLYLGTTVLLCAAAIAGIVALFAADSLAYLEINLTYTGLGLMLFGVAAAVGLSLTGSLLAWLGWLCVASAVAGFGVLMGAIWSIQDFPDEGNEDLLNAAGVLFLLSFALADAALVLSRWPPSRDPVLRVLVAVTLILVFAVATLVSIAIITSTGGETYFRLVAVIAVLFALGSALIPLRWSSRRPT